MKEVANAVLACLVTAICGQLTPLQAAPTREEAGAVFLYLRPLPGDAARLAFQIQGIAVRPEDGQTVPLALFTREALGERHDRERRLAGGELPPGRYSGLAVRIGAASLRGEDGEVELRSPSEPVIVPLPFTVEKGQGVVLNLEFTYRGSVDSGFRFTPVFSAGVAPRPAPGLLGLATSRKENVVTLFDKVSGRVAGIVPTGRRPTGIALDSGRERAYVAVANENMVEAIDLLKQTIVGRLRLRGGDNPVELALTPDGRTLLSANSGSSTVSVIEAIPLVEMARVAVGNIPVSVTVDPRGTRAYAFNSGSSTVTVVDIAARAAAGTIATEPGPLRGGFNRVGDRLYVIHRSSPYLSVIDPASLAVAQRVYVGTGATALRVDPQSDRVYLSRQRSRAVEVFDPLSLLPVDSIPIDGDVSFLAIDGEGNNLYAVLPTRNEVRVIRIVGLQTIARTEVGADPYGVVLSGER